MASMTPYELALKKCGAKKTRRVPYEKLQSHKVPAIRTFNMISKLPFLLRGFRAALLLLTAVDVSSYAAGNSDVDKVTVGTPGWCLDFWAGGPARLIYGSTGGDYAEAPSGAFDIAAVLEIVTPGLTETRPEGAVSVFQRHVGEVSVTAKYSQNFDAIRGLFREFLGKAKAVNPERFNRFLKEAPILGIQDVSLPKLEPSLNTGPRAYPKGYVPPAKTGGPVPADGAKRPEGDARQEQGGRGKTADPRGAR